MACIDCYSNCGGNVLSDKCVKYTGPDIAFLGIETGDQLSMVEASLIAKLETSLNGTGITFADFVACSSITEALDGSEETLSNIIQAMSDVICDLKADVADLIDDQDPPISFDAPCLTLSANPTRDQVLQAVVAKLCTIDTSVTTVLTNYVSTDTVCEIVQDCIDGSDAGEQEYSKLAKYAAVPYHGPLTVFDSQGRGLASAGYEKVYICNGQTVGSFTTPDYRGRSPLGVNQSIPGGAMDANVDPAIVANSGYGFVQGTKKGTFTHILTVNESAAHNHIITDPGHTHSYLKGGNYGHPGGSGQTENRRDDTGDTGSSPTGISLGSSGGSQPHNTTHPVIGAVFIMYIP